MLLHMFGNEVPPPSFLPCILTQVMYSACLVSSCLVLPVPCAKRPTKVMTRTTRVCMPMRRQLMMTMMTWRRSNHPDGGQAAVGRRCVWYKGCVGDSACWSLPCQPGASTRGRVIVRCLGMCLKECCLCVRL